MKKLLLIHISTLFISAAVYAQDQNKVIITGSRFTYPLVTKWIEEFKKINPDITFHLIPRGTPNVDSANFIINAHELTPEEIRIGFKVVNIARYALLPVANERNPLLKKYREKGIDEEDLKKLFFKKYDPLAHLDEAKESDKEKKKYKPTLYTREQKACAPTTFARNFGFEQADILGKPIAGDDNHLIAALKKDTNGITYNNLGFIYDRSTRLVQKGLSVIPLDLNSNGKIDADENFYQTLDDAIAAIERISNPELTLGYINISYPSGHKENYKNLSLFLTWVLNEGQKYSHEYGFLSLKEDVLVKQREILFSANK